MDVISQFIVTIGGEGKAKAQIVALPAHTHTHNALCAQIAQLSAFTTAAKIL
jgi:hypothetical protein